MHSLYLSPCRYSQHCFIAINSAPKDDDSMLVCFLLHQWTNEQFKYTNIPVLDLLVTVSEAWSTSTLETIVNPIPLGSGLLGGISSLPSTCPTHWVSNPSFQSLVHLLWGHLGQNEFHFFKYPNICITCSM